MTFYKNAYGEQKKLNMEVYTIPEIKERCVPLFERLPFIKKAWVFGSYSKGKAVPESDIDFFVDTTDGVGMRFFRLYDELADILDKPVDVLTKNEAMQLSDPKAVKEAILIYERGSNG